MSSVPSTAIKRCENIESLIQFFIKVLGFIPPATCKDCSSNLMKIVPENQVGLSFLSIITRAQNQSFRTLELVSLSIYPSPRELSMTRIIKRIVACTASFGRCSMLLSRRWCWKISNLYMN